MSWVFPAAITGFIAFVYTAVKYTPILIQEASQVYEEVKTKIDQFSDERKSWMDPSLQGSRIDDPVAPRPMEHKLERMEAGMYGNTRKFYRGPGNSITPIYGSNYGSL